MEQGIIGQDDDDVVEVADEHDPDMEEDVDEDDDEEDMDEEDDEGEEGDEDSLASHSNSAKARFSCDLCQLYFESQQQLQQHVKMHFLNGPGSVTLSELKSKSTKSRSSSSEVVTVSTS